MALSYEVKPLVDISTTYLFSLMQISKKAFKLLLLSSMLGMRIPLIQAPLLVLWCIT